MMNVRPDKVLRLTMLMHDFGKPACRTTDEKGIDHFYGHPAVSADMADNILRRLKYDNDTRKSVVKLTREHDRCVRLTEPGIRKAVIEIGEDLFPLWLEVKEADTLAQSLYRRQEKMDYLEKIRTVYGRILERGDCISLKDLAVTGNDLIAAGVPKGKEIGGLLRKMFQDVVDVPSHNDRDYLLKKYLPPVQAGDD
jgi:tRNA nucleotidyltransferase (CCA-adding enzyme)